jgi:hypothetical protein
MVLLYPLPLPALASRGDPGAYQAMPGAVKGEPAGDNCPIQLVKLHA